MDRFIVKHTHQALLVQRHLKSNMDRFIEIQLRNSSPTSLHLKSNMDRFIANSDNITIF